MRTSFALLVGLTVATLPALAGGMSGKYVEARTCDVWVGACFANAEMNLTGKHAVMAWKFDQGSENGVSLAGLGVVAVVEATDTLGLKQTGEARSVLLVDEKATPAQREALIHAARKLGGDLVKNVIDVKDQPIDIQIDCCPEKGCAKVDAGLARVRTRCIYAHEDSVCGHEDNFYPPLANGLSVTSAMVTEHSFSGKAFNATWNDTMRRGAYLGTFKAAE